MKQQIDELISNQLELDKHDNRTRSEIQKLNDSMASLSENIQMTKEMLFEWKEIVDDNQESHELIEKYCKMDMSRAETLESKRRLVQASIDKQRKILIDATEEQKSLEQTLERTSQLYRQAHIERRNMVSTWKEAVNQMVQREKDIKDTENEIERAFEVSRIKKDRLMEVTKKFDLQIVEKKALEINMEELNMTQSVLRQKYNELQEALQTNGSELLTLRKTVQSVAQKLANQRVQNKRLVQEESDKELAYRKSVGEVEALKKKHENFKTKTMNAQERLKQLDEFIEAEEKSIKVLDEETSRLGGAVFRAEQQLHKMQETEKLLEVLVAFLIIYRVNILTIHLI